MENWRFIEANSDYMVSDHGRILSFKGKSKLIIKTTISTKIRSNNVFLITLQKLNFHLLIRLIPYFYHYYNRLIYNGLQKPALPHYTALYRPARIAR